MVYTQPECEVILTPFAHIIKNNSWDRYTALCGKKGHHSIIFFGKNEKPVIEFPITNKQAKAWRDYDGSMPIV